MFVMAGSRGGRHDFDDGQGGYEWRNASGRFLAGIDKNGAFTAGYNGQPIGAADHVFWNAFGSNIGMVWRDSSGTSQGMRMAFMGLVLANLPLGFTTSAPTTNTADLWVSRGGVATIQHGAADAAAAIPQFQQSQSVAAGNSNVAGAKWTRLGSKGTGTGGGGSIEEMTAPASASGTAQNSPVTRDLIAGPGKALTSGSAISLFDLTLPPGAMASGQLIATILATDGTDMQSFSQIINYAAVNKAGTYTSTLTADTAADAKAVSSGTLTTAWSVANGGTATVTVTIAAPGVMTWTGHPFVGGEQIHLTTSGALPTGLAINTQYWVTVVDANTIKLSTSFLTYLAGTFITTTGTQSGTHTGNADKVTVQLTATTSLTATKFLCYWQLKNNSEQWAFAV